MLERVVSDSPLYQNFVVSLDQIPLVLTPKCWIELTPDQAGYVNYRPRKRRQLPINECDKPACVIEEEVVALDVVVDKGAGFLEEQDIRRVTELPVDPTPGVKNVKGVRDAELFQKGRPTLGHLLRATIAFNRSQRLAAMLGLCHQRA
jgi:hypothetical protein